MDRNLGFSASSYLLSTQHSQSRPIHVPLYYPSKLPGIQHFCFQLPHIQRQFNVILYDLKKKFLHLVNMNCNIQDHVTFYQPFNYAKSQFFKKICDFNKKMLPSSKFIKGPKIIKISNSFLLKTVPFHEMKGHVALQDF